MFWVVFLATVEEHLGVWSAWAFADLPEIAFERDHMVWDHALLDPKLKGGFIHWVISDVEFLFWKTKAHFFIGEKLKGPRDDLIAEIVSDGEVSEHLKESVVTGGMSDVLDVVGADALLDVGQTSARWDLAAIEIFLKSGDACVDPKKRLVAMRD